MEKPPVLSELLRRIHQISEDYYSTDHSPGGVSFYEYLAHQLLNDFQQARQDTAREIFEEIEKLPDFHTYEGIGESDWQSLKSKYLGGSQ